MKETGIRLSQFLKDEDIEQKQVAIALGVTPQYVSGLCHDKPLGKKIAAKLQELYGVNSGWLLTGYGQRRIRKPEEDIVRVCEDFTEQEEPKQSYKKGKPYYNVDFALGFDLLENDQTRTADYLIDFAPYNAVCDLWCNAHGDSMHPTISSGDIVALKRIEDFSYLINGQIYAIVTSNGLRTIKRIRDNGDTLTLIADNPSVGEQIIPKEYVTHAFLVRGSIKMF